MAAAVAMAGCSSLRIFWVLQFIAGLAARPFVNHKYTTVLRNHGTRERGWLGLFTCLRNRHTWYVMFSNISVFIMNVGFNCLQGMHVCIMRKGPSAFSSAVSLT